jgi:hypothetical protein
MSELEPELRGTLADFAREHPDEIGDTRARRLAARRRHQARLRIVGAAVLTGVAVAALVVALGSGSGGRSDAAQRNLEAAVDRKVTTDTKDGEATTTTRKPGGSAASATAATPPTSGKKATKETKRTRRARRNARSQPNGSGPLAAAVLGEAVTSTNPPSRPSRGTTPTTRRPTTTTSRPTTTTSPPPTTPPPTTPPPTSPPPTSPPPTIPPPPTTTPPPEEPPPVVP